MTDTTDDLDLVPQTISNANELLNQPTELALLKQRADDMNIKYSPNIGLKTLRDKVNERLQPVNSNIATASKIDRHNKIRKEATKLIRVRVSNLNPNKKHSEGEFFRTGNSVITTIARFVPFESDTHIENMLLTLLKQREYCIVVEKKNSEGKLVPIRQMRREFQIEVLPPLTQKELDDLSIAQSRRQSV